MPAGLRDVVCGVWFVWDSVGHAAQCVGSLDMLARKFRPAYVYCDLAGCSSLCDLVSLVGEEHTPL